MFCGSRLNKNHLLRQLIIIIFLIFCTQGVHSQETDLSVKKNAVSFSVMGINPLAGFTYERSLSNYLIAELGIGYVSGGVGFKYYPLKAKLRNVSPYIAVNVSVSPLYGDCELCVGGDGILGYFPVGISFFGKRGLNLNLNGGLATIFKDNRFLYGGLSIGKRF